MKALKGFYITYGVLVILFLLVEFYRLIMDGKDFGTTLAGLVAVWFVFVILPVVAIRLLVRLL